MEEVSPDKKKRPLRGALRFFMFVALAAMVLAGGLVGAIFFFEDEIKAAIIKEVNKSLRAEVRVDPKNIDVTILSTFPSCALRFKKVLMLEALKKKDRDTLLYAGKLDLHFDFMDMWRGKYEIHRLSIEDCIIKPVIDAKGEPNYEFWQKPEQAEAGNASFRLNDVRIRRARIKYKDKKSKSATDLALKSLDLRGDFSNKKYDIDAKASIQLHFIKVSGSYYAKEKNIEASLGLVVRGDEFGLRQSTIKINDLALALGGGFKYGKKLESLDLKYKAPGLDIGALLSLLPERYREKISGYESSGTIYADGDISWKNEQLKASGNFGARNAVVTYSRGNASAKGIDFKGSFSYGDEMFVELRDLKMELEGGTVAGNFRLEGRENPDLTLEAVANTDLASLNRLCPLDTLQKLSGHLRLDVRVRGALSDLQKLEPDENVMVRIQAQVNDLVTQFKNDDKTYNVASCLLKADNNEIEVRNLVLRRGTSDITINGKLPGFVRYVLGKPGPLRIEGTLRSEHLTVNDFVPVEKGKAAGVSPGPLIPANIELNVSSSIGKLGFGKFEATDLSGLIEIKDQKLFLNEVNLQTMQGSATINALADNSKGKLNVWVESSLKKINIAELFRQMNDFGQTTLQEKHINGFATAELKFSGTWNNKLETDLQSIKTLCDLTIDKGELIGFSPLLSLARFVDVKELGYIKFGQLTSRIEIAGEKIVIPRTSIKNSAINLEFWGSHTFNHEIDYHFQMLTADLLKAKKRKVTNDEEFGTVARDADNTRSIFIVMTGNLNNPKIRYDKQGMQQKIRGDIKKERENLKQLIREEFGFNDKNEKSGDKQEKTPAFKLEESEKKPAKKELVLKKKEEDDF